MNRISGIGQEVKIEIRDKRGRIKAIHTEQRAIAQLMKRVVIRGPDGKVKEDTGPQPAHSFTIKFLKLLEIYWRTYWSGGLVYPTVPTINTLNVSKTPIPTATDHATSRYANLNLKALDDNDAYGIVVGTGTGAESNTDYALGTKIAHGSGAGQLDYGPQSFVEPYVNGAYCDLVLSRTFYNGSGSPITAYEFGVYIKTTCSGGSFYFCIIRDMEAAGKTVLAGDSMVVQYTIRVGSGFTRTFLYALLSFFNDTNYTRNEVAGTPGSIVEDTGSATVVGMADGYLGANNPTNNDDFGLVIGSGTAVEDFEDYQLAAKIENTAITYLNQSWTTTAVVGANVDLVLSRSFYNDKAASVDINEITFQAHDGANHGAPGIALIRDKLTGTVTIAVGDTGTIQVTFRTNVAD